MAQRICVGGLLRGIVGTCKSCRAACSWESGAALSRPCTARPCVQRSGLRLERGSLRLTQTGSSSHSRCLSVRAERFPTLEDTDTKLDSSKPSNAVPSLSPNERLSSPSILNVPDSSAVPSLFEVPGPSPDVRGVPANHNKSDCDADSASEAGATSFLTRLLRRRNSPSEKTEGNLFDVGPRLAKHLEDSIPSRWRGLILLNVLTFLYGSNITVVKEASAVLDPFSFSAARFSIAAIAFAPFLMSAFKNPNIKKAGLELGVWASIAYVTQAVGLLTTEAGRASFIGTFTVIEVPILAGLFGAKIPGITWVAALAAICGVGLLESSGAESSFMGDVWTIISALVFGVHILRSEHHAKHVTTAEALPLISLQLAVTAVLSTLWVSVGSGTGMLPNCGWEALVAGQWGELANWPWLEMVYTGVFSTALCLWIEVVALKDVSAPEAAMVYTLEPLWGAGFAWVLLGERWGPMGWAGAALILGGSIAMQLFGHSEEGEAHGASDEKLLPPAPAYASTSFTSLLHKDGSSTTALNTLSAAAAIALVLTASTTAVAGDVSSNNVLSWVKSMGRWAEGEVEMVVEGEYEVGLSRAALAALGGEELASLTSLIKAYALVRQDEESEAEEKLSRVVV